MTKLPLVSIITPSYNQAPFLEETIRTVLGQGYPNLEYIVVDGGSTDHSVEIIQKYADRIAWWVSEPDKGQAHAINKGLKRARGEYVAWLNSDDLYLPNAVRHAAAALQQNPAASMVHGDGILIDSEKRILDWHRYHSLTTLDLMCWQVLLQPTVFMRRSVLEKTGYLNTDYHLILDHELWIRFALQGPIIHVPEFWAAERTHPEAKTIASAADFVGEAQRLVSSFPEIPEYRNCYEGNRHRIDASLCIFSARRLIDNRQYRIALGFFWRALFIKPALVLKAWYKVIQAFLGVVGLESGFLWYRNTRRRLQHQGKTLFWDGDLLRYTD
ncbi:MAG: glycosyltransferase [Anaerolineales bacterium]|nr:glycosyltransferase [Anaerolineales bacterium]